MSMLPGLKLYHDGQFVGKQTKLPVQLGRAPKEEINEEIQIFYDKLLKITKDKIFSNGEFTLLTPIQAWDDNCSHNNILAWMWNYKNHHRLVIVNDSTNTSVCRIRIDSQFPEENITFNDLLNNKKYIRLVNEIKEKGLYIQLESFECHIFSFR